MSDENPHEASADALDAPPADASPGWHALLRAALLDEHPDDIVLIGSRAAALLAAERETSSPGTVRWHRYDSLADCASAPPEERHADVALFAPATLDGLERALGAASRLFPIRLLLLVESSGAPASGNPTSGGPVSESTASGQPDPSSGFPASGLPAPERLFAFGFRRVFAVSGRASTSAAGSGDGSGGGVGGESAEGAADGDTGGDRGDTPVAALYEYRLRDYKQPPEWLNARFWANPARFDLDEDGEGFGDDTDEFEDDDEDDRTRG